MRPLSIRERKLVAVGLLILVIALVWAVAIGPVIDGFTSRKEERAVLLASYERNSRLINAIPAARRRAEQRSGLARQFAIRGPNITIARAALRDRLREAFVAAGGEVTALQDVPAAPGDVRAWVQGRIALAQLQGLLIRIGDAQPYLVTDSLRITADRALESGRLDILDVRLEASIPFIPAAS